jgi:hypothetical protein
MTLKMIKRFVYVRPRNEVGIYDMIYLLTAVGLTTGGSSTVHIYTQTIHRMTQNKHYIEQHKHFGRVRALPPSLQVIPWHLPYN